MILFACFAVANPVISNINHDKVLKDFDIQNNTTNKFLVYSIYKTIPKSDRDLFRKIIKTKSHNAYLIKKELDELNAPEFFLYLAMVESHLSNKATSGVKAAGIWQFMPGTARNFGLRVDQFVDERRDPRASTSAAFSYLSHLKDNFGNWYLALMAYNCGEARLKKAIEKTGSSDFEKLLNGGNLPKETTGFIKKIIRYSYIATSSDVRKSLKFENKPSEYKRILVAPGTNLSGAASSIGVPVSEFAGYNPHIKQDSSSISGKYHFYIPENKLNLFVVNYASKKYDKANTTKQNHQTHLVAKNENLGTIAKKWGVSVKDIKVANNLKSDKVLLNQKIKIPSAGKKVANTKKYVVKKGDTLVSISEMFAVKSEDIIALNDIKNGEILVGDNIVIP